MRQGKRCQRCIFLRMLLMGALGAIAGAYAAPALFDNVQDRTWGMIVGIALVFVLGRRWLR